ncbi:ParB/RepB/Spo0J family partition protein [Lapidilactobacillus bayanensis]|uniref:ParB/RepB/Spo0J family partition protein n=1 Tax=Lapidilactobacillus bayanensis TaxID=2485998 RepID=UPI000F778BCB|nr:ParB/RepB/Spo0J family partition protein [Lapidilactobacillus bayanensis]
MAFFDSQPNHSNNIRQNSHDQTEEDIQQIPVLQIVPNRFQPRKQFSAESIAELAGTIAAHGLLQPIVLREYSRDHYEIIAGERRFRAVQSLGWANISAIIKQMTDQESAEMAVIENLQRENLNPIDEANAYQKLLDVTHVTQGQLAQRLGKSQSYVANQLRLLKLPEAAQKAIAAGQITARHGRTLLKLDSITQTIVLKQILTDHLTVSQTDQLIASLNEAPQTVAKQKKATKQIVDKPLDLNKVAVKIKQTLKKMTTDQTKITYQEKHSQDHYTITIDVSVDQPNSKEEN